MAEAAKLILSLSLSGSFMILLLLALRPLLKERLAKSWQYYLWIVVLLRLVIPYTPTFGLQNMIFQKNETQNTGVTEQYIQSAEGVTSTTPGSVSNASEPGGMPANTTDGSAKQISGWELAGYIWLAGAALLLLFKGSQFARFSKKLRSGAEVVNAQDILSIFGVVAEERGVKKTPALLVSEQIQSPMLVGLIKPAIMLPAGALCMSNDGLRYVFHHELTHYKRLDILLKWSAEIIGCIHWFNPLLYVMLERISRQCELSCDEAVACDLDEFAKVTYGDTLLAAAADFGISGNSVLSTTLCEDKKSLKERLSAILKAKRKSIKTRILTIILALSLVAAAVVLGACSAVDSSNNGGKPGDSPAITTPSSPEATPSASTPSSSSPAVSDSDPTPPVETSSAPTDQPVTDGGVYKNTQYGFDFYLPKDWEGYKIITEQWEGVPIGDASSVKETGPKLSIRNPKWSSDNPMQDIPIMIFTLDQWAKLQKEEFAVSAAPVGPSELGRNSQYVFALPPRYNFSYATGWEEVEDILNGAPLHANESIGK